MRRQGNMISLDVLRGMYVRSPHWVRNVVSWPLSILPVSIQYGRQYKVWREKITVLRNDRELRVQYVKRSIIELLRKASAAPYYRDMFKTIWGNDAPFFGEFDHKSWLNIPILDKMAIRENLQAFLASPKANMDLISTGGTSGHPIAFYVDKNRSVAEIAFCNDAWSVAGYVEGDTRCVFRGVLIQDVSSRFMEFEPALRELRCSPFHLTKQPMDLYIKEIQKRQIRFIHGYPSAISIFASHVALRGLAPFEQIEGIFPISEKLLPYQRCLLRNVFPRSVIVPFYGLSEKVAFATEVVGRPDAYEFNPIYGLAELVNDKGQIVTEPGQRGKIVGTGFISVGMPFIRYDTEDEATLEQAPSPENGYVLTVRDIGSRWRQEFLVSTNGALVSIAAINIHSQAYRSVREFQFYQDEPGRALLRVILADGATGAHAEVFADEIRKKIAGSIDIAVELTDRIDATQRGKRKFIDQRISQLPLIDTG